jgi:hypothetical protein
MLELGRIDRSLFSDVLDGVVLSLEFLEFDVVFGDVRLEGVDIGLQVSNGLEIHFIAGLEISFGTDLLVLEEIVSVFKVSKLRSEVDIVSFGLSEFEDLSFELRDDKIFLVTFNLSGTEISIVGRHGYLLWVFANRKLRFRL